MADQRASEDSMTPEGLEERLVFFPCGALSLAGILTVPPEPNGRTVLIPWTGGTIPSSGRNRVRMRLARILAEQGFYAFRFDYQGVGESEGDFQRADMAAPNTEEIVAAGNWLTSQGLPHIVVVGLCFGAWSSLMAAPMIPGLEGMALVNSPVRRDHKEVRASWRWWVTRLKRPVLKKLRRPEHRAAYRRLVARHLPSLVGLRSSAKASSSVGAVSRDKRFSRAVGYLLDRHIPLLLMYDEDQDFRADLEAEFERGLRAAIDQAGPPTRLITVSERLGVASLSSQAALLKGVVPWLHELPSSRVGGAQPVDLNWARGDAGVCGRQEG
jgi:pimeloyl-ACP methyl ester carboxylesterase